MKAKIKRIRGQMVVKVVAIICLFILNLQNVMGQKKNADIELKGFRDFEWGISSELVRANEVARYRQLFSGFGKSVITFYGTFLNRGVDIDFTFVNDSLTQGAYVFESGENDFKSDFYELKEYLTGEYGRPASRAGNNIDSDSVWTKISIYELYSGPQYFWHFKNGFIALHSARDEDKISLTILYVGNRTIIDYLNDRSISVDDYKIIE